MRDNNRMTASDLAFANQAAAQEIIQAEKMALLLDNLANTSIQKNDTIDKLVATYQQQAKTIADLTEAIAKLKNGSPQMKQWVGCKNPPHWRSIKSIWDTTWYCWAHDFGLRLDTAALFALFPEKDIVRMLRAQTRRLVATSCKAGPNLPLDRARQRT
jgi:hypothetical protein